MLQEIREAVATAARLVDEIGLRFRAGDPASESVSRLEAALTTLTRLTSGKANTLPDDLRAAMAKLHADVQATIAVGDEWLARTGPELAAQNARLRLKRAYGVF